MFLLLDPITPSTYTHIKGIQGSDDFGHTRGEITYLVHVFALLCGTVRMLRNLHDTRLPH